MIAFMFARNSITGPRLKEFVGREGVQTSETSTGARGVVCYGAPYRGTLPCLNGNAGTFNKLEELQRMSQAGVRTPPFSADGRGLTFPLLGRQLHHTKGKDIIPIFGPRELEFARRGASQFFTQYVPLDTEFRVWAYRRRNIGTYQKVFKYPTNYKRFGCNNENGFAFEHRDFQPALLDLASRALEALGLDFGAVDVLRSSNGQDYVLEVNTAPGTEQGVLSRLARRIARWHELGCPKRRGTAE